MAIAFTHAHVLTMTSAKPLIDHTVLVEGGTISAIGPTRDLRVPADVGVVDVAGKTLMPGLCDMHVHIVPTQDDEASEVNRLGALAMARQYLAVVLAGGVTTVRNMAGTPFHLRLRSLVRSGDVVGPRIFTAGPLLETSFTLPGMEDSGELVKTPGEARAAVLRHRDAGYDCIKVYNQLDAGIYDEIVRTCREVGLQVVGHVAFSKGLSGALEAGQDSIEHFRSYDFALDVRGPEFPGARFVGWLHTTPARVREVAERTASAQVWNVPTLGIERGLAGLKHRAQGDDTSWLPPWMRQMLERLDLAGVFTPEQIDAIARGAPVRLELLAALDRAGAPLMAGTDCPGCGLIPGRSLLQELELYVEAGLSPYRALQTATSEPARFLGKSDEWGQLAVGMAADLLVLDRSPLEDITALREQAGVMTQGRWLPTAAIRELILAA